MDYLKESSERKFIKKVQRDVSVLNNFNKKVGYNNSIEGSDLLTLKVSRTFKCVELIKTNRLMKAYMGR